MRRAFFATGQSNEVSMDNLHTRLYCAIANANTTVDPKEVVDAICRSSFRRRATVGIDDDLNFYHHAYPRGLLSPFSHAVIEGDASTALYLLKQGCSPFRLGCEKYNSGPPKPSLNKCIKKIFGRPGFDPVLLHLFELSMNVTAKGVSQRTFLHSVCEKRMTPVLKAILCHPQLNKMLFMADANGLLPIHVAAKSNFVDFFEFVYNYESCGEIPFDLGNDASQSQISVAIFNPPWNEITSAPDSIRKTWKNKNLNINIRVKGMKVTALHLAARHRNVEIVKLLLERHADVHALAGGSRTPLMECLDATTNMRGNDQFDHDQYDRIYQICKLLIEAGASVNVLSTIPYSRRFGGVKDERVNPLHLAATTGYKPIVQLLVNKGCDATALSSYTGRIPLHFALEKGKSECAEVLLSESLYPEGFLASYLDYSSNTLFHSVENCSEEIWMRLMALKCPLDRPNVKNVRPLDKAVGHENVNFVRMLLERQPYIVNVHLYQEPKGKLPLHVATSVSLRLTNFLLSYGADIYGRTYGQPMAFRKAFKYNQYGIGIYLCEQMSCQFTLAEKEELLSHRYGMMEYLYLRLKARLDMIPSLQAKCLDTVRQAVISSRLSLRDVDTLPLPRQLIAALRYQF